MAVRSGAEGGAGAPGGHRITGDPTRGCRGGAGRGLRLGAAGAGHDRHGPGAGGLGPPSSPAGSAGAGPPCPARSAAGPAWGGVYRPAAAQAAARARLARPKIRKPDANPALRERVVDLLEDRVSPRQIAARLRFENPDDGSMRICHEQIHPGARVRPGRRQPARPVAGGGGPAHRTHPPHTRAPHWPEKPEPRGKEPDTGAPPSVCARPRGDEGAVPGHWEGDLIIARRPPAAP